MALDQLQIINDALLATANDPINALNDGSTEWQVGSNAFRRALEELISQNTWQFSKTLAALVGAGGTNPSKRFDYHFTRPAAAWLIRSVIWRDLHTVPFEIIGNLICADKETELTCEFVRQPTDAEVPPWFFPVLTKLAEGYILQGPNEDYDEAERRFKWARTQVAEAKSLEARQTPARPGFNGKMALARRSRRGGTYRPPAGEEFP